MWFIQGATLDIWRLWLILPPCSGLCSCWRPAGTHSHSEEKAEENKVNKQHSFHSLSSSGFYYLSPPLAFWLQDGVISTTTHHSFCSPYYVCFFQTKNGGGRMKSLCQKHWKHREHNWEGVRFIRGTVSRTHPCSCLLLHKDTTHVLFFYRTSPDSPLGPAISPSPSLCARCYMILEDRDLRLENYTSAILGHRMLPLFGLVLTLLEGLDLLNH